MTERIQTLTKVRRTSLRAVWAHFLRGAALARTRQRLALLDDHQLRDIGLTRSEALSEAALPVWDAPQHWKC